MSNQITQKRIVAAIAALLILGCGSWLWSSRFEETDNAYTAAHVAAISPKVAGLVTDVLVEENYKVKKDQVLVRIDARDYQNALNSLKGELGEVESTLYLADKNYRRSARLYEEKAVPQQDVDNDLSRLKGLQKKKESLLARIEQARLNLDFTEIRAPSDGTVGKKLVEPGMVISPGQPVLSFVDSQTPWVIANFKETQLRKMKIGQKCDIVIDAIGGKTFEGVVESFAPGSGATFALIPPDNATGNFTKIVQRVPVRIRFLEDSIRGYADRIVPGLSSEATVRLNEFVGPSTAIQLVPTELTKK